MNGASDLDTVIYIHGMGGNAGEAEHYAPLFPCRRVIGFDYKAQTPWEAKEEFAAFFEQNAKGDTILVANSLGAYFSMHARLDSCISRAYFISPVVDMESIILSMMRRAGVGEDELERAGVIRELSWEYLSYVRANPIKWSAPTEIIYGELDALTPYDTMRDFALRIGARLSVMEGGEHWFHTKEQMDFLDEWIKGRCEDV